VTAIEQRFGEAAYPVRILMAELPQGAELIPNPVNQVPGFALRQHYFLPGFPQMAHPMAEWVLQQYYPDGPGQSLQALRVFDVAESDIMPLLQELDRAHPEAQLFSLPRIDQRRSIELGFKGPEAPVAAAFADLLARVEARGLRYQREQAD
jgi:molybdopterin-biosynthesis enzyme MoeA-like protein